MFSVLYADQKGRLRDDPELKAMGRTGTGLWELEESDLIPMPEGSDLVLLPDRQPIGVNPRTGEAEVVDRVEGIKGMPVAVAATLPVGYTRSFLPGYERMNGSKRLPLFGYTAVALRGDDFYVAAVRTDEPGKWNPLGFNGPELQKLVESRVKAHPGNRILEQLAKCSLEYHCCTAQNIFYGRWEGGIPVSPFCNADCFGCISLQPSECCPSPQARIGFVPTVEEITEIAVPHLESAEDAIVSFGQGCEGDPLTQGPLLIEAIREIRGRTKSGTININTNAGLTRYIPQLAEAGLDTVRVSLFSPVSDEYDAYHRPGGYGLSDVCKSIRICSGSGVKVSLNLLTFPGFTDVPHRAEALAELVRDNGVGLVQLRNLNIDPDALYEELGLPEDEDALGIAGFIGFLADELPHLMIGNYSKPV